MLLQLLQAQTIHCTNNMVECQISQNHLKVCYTNQPLFISSLPVELTTKIRYLTFAHCQMTSLEGIQQFCSIKHLNLKYNQLKCVSQLSRLRDKKALTLLNLTGNHLEYFKEVRYNELVKIFSSLQELNGKNYRQILVSRPQKNIKMQKIMNKMGKIKQEMAKTLKKQSKKNRIKLQRYPTQKQLTQQSYEWSQERQNYEDDEKQNYLQLNNLHETNIKDISLGKLSNIPMSKSIRNNKKNMLQINTDQEKIAQHMPLTQPTATFAVSKLADTHLMFKKEQKLRMSYKKLYQKSQLVEEQRQIDYLNNSNLRIHQNDSEFNNSYDQEDCLLSNPKVHLEEQCKQLGEGHYLRTLMKKVFYGYQKQLQRPCKPIAF